MNAIVHLWEWLHNSTSHQVITLIQGCGGEDYKNSLPCLQAPPPSSVKEVIQH